VHKYKETYTLKSNFIVYLSSHSISIFVHFIMIASIQNLRKKVPKVQQNNQKEHVIKKGEKNRTFILDNLVKQDESSRKIMI